MTTTAAVLALAAAGLSGCGPDSARGSGDDDEGGFVEPCDWPAWGQSAERTFSYPDDCATDLGPDTVDGLAEAWSFTTDDAVTATPAVAGGRVFVGDWSGRFYALDLESGELAWSFEAEVHPQVYAGQIVSSAAVGRALVYFGAGKTLYALDARLYGVYLSEGTDDPVGRAGVRPRPRLRLHRHRQPAAGCPLRPAEHPGRRRGRRAALAHRGLRPHGGHQLAGRPLRSLTPLP